MPPHARTVANICINVTSPRTGVPVAARQEGTLPPSLTRCKLRPLPPCRRFCWQDRYSNCAVPSCHHHIRPLLVHHQFSILRRWNRMNLLPDNFPADLCVCTVYSVPAHPLITGRRRVQCTTQQPPAATDCSRLDRSPNIPHTAGQTGATYTPNLH